MVCNGLSVDAFCRKPPSQIGTEPCRPVFERGLHLHLALICWFFWRKLYVNFHSLSILISDMVRVDDSLPRRKTKICRFYAAVNTMAADQLLTAGPWFNIKMPSYQHRISHCGDKTILRSSYLHNRISYTGKTTLLYLIRAQHAGFNLVFPAYSNCSMAGVHHDDVIKRNYFPRYWPFVRGIHRSPVNSPHKGQWCGVWMFSLICTWINSWVNNREAGDLIRHCVHYDIIVMESHWIIGLVNCVLDTFSINNNF